MGPDPGGGGSPNISIGFSFSIAWSSEYNPNADSWLGSFSEINFSEGPIDVNGFWSETWQGIGIGGNVGPVPISGSYIPDVDYQYFP